VATQQTRDDRSGGPDRALRWIGRAVLVLGIALGVGITVAADQAQDRARRHAAAVAWGEQFVTIAERLDDTGDDVWTRESLTDELRSDIADQRGELHDLVTELQESLLAARELPAVTSALASYEAAVEAHFGSSPPRTRTSPTARSTTTPPSTRASTS
jgi:hypothetical protein